MYSAADHLIPTILRSIVDHVFMPPELPQAHPGNRTELKTNEALCNNLIKAARDFHQSLSPSQGPLWIRMIKMLELARRAAKTPFREVELQRALSDMAIGDVFCMHIRAQNAALIVRRLGPSDIVQFEVFEVSPRMTAVMKAEGKLLCSYPGPAIQVPADVFMDECFLRELSSFLIQMDVDRLDSSPTTSSGESVHPRYISELLVGILRGFGRPAVVNRITKRIGDEVLRDGALKPWRRSPLWLILRVSLQSSLRDTNLYKPFILFFHVYLLHTCVSRDFPSELLYAMRVKVARRFSKLHTAVPRHVCRFVHDTAKETEALLLKRWISFQTTGPNSPASQFEVLDFVADSHISLDKSYDYLTKMLQSSSSSSPRTQFIPSNAFRLCDVRDFSHFTNGQLAGLISRDPWVAIMDFEMSVERNLEPWVAASTNNDDAINVIASCIQQYYSGAKDLYGTNAEDNSIMILTIMDLWVALDRFVVQECPLLKQYPPEIPSEFLHCLLLHRSSALKRASFIEEYLCRRHKDALKVTSIFSDNVDDSCFAVKYFHTSANLMRIYEEISAKAQQERAVRRAELTSLNLKSKSLLRQASKLDHERIRDKIVGDEIHIATCRKCRLEYEARTLTIRIHEWPLPSSTAHARQVVFELSPPRAFSIWRDITYMILHDIGLPSVPDWDNQPKVPLDSIPGLKQWAVPSHRVTIGSTTDSFPDRIVVIPAAEFSVFADTGLSFQLFDSIRKSWVTRSFSESSGSKLCMPPVPTSSPYSRIHHFVSGTQHMPNQIISTQADCPEEISLHEYIAFSGLRRGPRLQWLNIARELASPFLSFRREEVHTLITLAAWQLGPLSNGIREWHADLSIFSFGNALLLELESLLEKIKENWLEEVAVRTIALICNRLLSSTVDSDIFGQACALLREARNLTYRWMGEMSMKLDSTQDEISRAGLRYRLCMLAATCFSTFNVFSEHDLAALVSEDDISIAMQCAVVIHDNTPASLSDDESLYLTRMLSRHRRLLHGLEPIFSQTLDVLGRARLCHAGAYDHALARLWLGYRQHNSSTWHALPRPNSRLISRVTGGLQVVHFDLLTGELLIDGKRFGRLPKDIVEHPTYASIFGTRILDVSPADVPGMDYMTRSTVSGYQILFSWNNGDLILQARKPEDSQILQFIPRSILFGDFPRIFVDEYIHWLNLGARKLEFRQVGSPWTSGPSNWRLYIQKSGVSSHAMIQKPYPNVSHKRLIDIRSSTFVVVSSMLSPLESSENIIAMLTARKTLEVSLPRLRLSFFVNTNWELECRSMPGYVVDKTQSCGTLFGLRNKLILCPSPTSSEKLMLPRRIIIPYGDISFSTHGDFTSVSINTGSEQHVRWHEYTIDTDLGRLTSNTSLSSKLYQCYLHALTSHCLPDPLLGHTGTEEALYILRSAGCRSFQRLGVPEAKLLELISNLSPVRVYHSRHLQSMATVNWNDLPALLQHHDFFRVVCSLLDHARALEALYDPRTVFNTLNRNQTLLNRAAFRNKSYYPSDLHISNQSSSIDDVEYKSRDVPDLGTAEDMAFRTSWSIWNAQPSLEHRSPDLWVLMTSWGSIGPARSRISLRYSPGWLEFNAARDWLQIYDLCRKSASGNPRNLRITLSFSLSAAAYSQSKYSNILPTLVIFAFDKRCRNLRPPPLEGSYSLSDGLEPELAHLKDLVLKSALPISSTPARFRWELYDDAIERGSSTVAESILRQWPHHHLVDFLEQWFAVFACKSRINEYMESISRNIRLNEHVLQLQNITQHYTNVLVPPAVPYVFLPQFITSNSKPSLSTLRDVLLSRTDVPTPTPSAKGDPFQDRVIPLSASADDTPPPAGSDSLEVLIEELRHSQQPLLQLYGNGLDKSHCKLLGQSGSQFEGGFVPSHEILLYYYDECFRRKEALFSEILAALAPSTNVEETSSIAGLWPRITPRSILSQFAQDRIGTLPDQWKLVITRFAVSLLIYRQSVRLLELSSRQECEDMLHETEAIFKDVLAESIPDWLLVQIEANIMARPLQVAIAREMISPSSGRNISLQLNMGDGKTSVIVPLVVSTLANGSNLVRVVTLKPLSNQMFQMLVSRLSGLANRPIFYVPISRSLRMDISLARTTRGLYERCVAEGGVLVVQPEHILSLKLMHIDILLRSVRNRQERSIADELGSLQDWLGEVSRDVLDESDEILHVRYQLVYTAGKPMPVDDHPNRWTTIQQVFGRLQALAVTLHASCPKMFTVDSTQRGFPIIRILDSAVFHRISLLIVDDALGGALPNLPLGVLPSPVRAAVRRFMAQREISDVDQDLIHSHCAGTPLFNGILLVRGLLMDGEGILGYVLKERRWKVDYGLDPRRTLLAVPYRAKDVPSLRAEFAHPDVAIALTCLSYYYGGLTKEQMLLCFELLAKLDNPEMEYDHWVELEHDLPTALRQLNGVNTEDEGQVDDLLVPLFSRNKRVVDFYLSQIVFPRAAREFPSKLLTSAWDLVEEKKNVTTGFSGTNDNRYLLPTSITQEDPDFVLGTNALVLQHLLRPENDYYECTEGENGEREFAAAFLKRLVKQDPEIRVLLDVGAQMLELKNEELARHWLSLRPDVSAAIFFDDSDHLTVVTPDGTVEPFISSPFNRQLEKCVVYLDDAHTRGTDLKLPRGMRAAVTLGPKVTKDRLVQGCMRMRQLGKGHSVMFFAPGEVDHYIRSLIPSGTPSEDRIRVLDVLRWAMHETCQDIRHRLPYWAQQGCDHHKRFAAYQRFRSGGDLDVLRSAWSQSDSQTLEEMYWIAPVALANPAEIRSVPSLSERIERLGVTKLVDVRMAEEQEREVDHEVEPSHSTDIGRPRPPRVQPAQHVIHRDIREFIETGKLPESSAYISPLLSPLNMAKALESTTDWSPSPLATEDFTTTVLGSSGSQLTEYLRPVNWILSSGHGKDSIVVAISPHEADALLPAIRRSDKVRLHIYAPRVTSSMRSFSDLTFYSIPAPADDSDSSSSSQAKSWSAPMHVRTSLNLFAGQLYFDSREEYERVCALLALSMAHPGAEYSERDGFVPPEFRTGKESPFERSRVPVLKKLIGLRRKGMDYYRTHLGQILNGKPLSDETLSRMPYLDCQFDYYI